MPRIGALLSLSREHHTSLVMARDARRAANEKDATAVSMAMARVEAHWHTLLAEHFEQEERLIQIAEDTLDPESVARILAEHGELRMLASGPCTLEPTARLRRFGDLLGAHVRYEERVFFPQLQSHPCVAAVAANVDAQI
jgi:hypothetical protein